MANEENCSNNNNNNNFSNICNNNILSNNVDLKKLIEIAKRPANLQRLRSVEFRKQQLNSLLRLYNEQEKLLVEALQLDLGKPYMEGICSEVETVKNEIRCALRNIDQWTKNRIVPKTLATITDNVYTIRKPFGLVLIIGPWNYPSFSNMIPLIGAIAAGNTAIIKPSEIASATANFFQQMIPKYLDKDCYQVVVLDVEGTQQLLMHKFDYIFFIGSPKVGKLIYKAAAEQLTPVTLELGGKCPVYVDQDLKDVRVAVKRILWGKFFNAGQTCIAPDYLLCTSTMASVIVEHAKSIIKGFYGSNPAKSKDFARIIDQRNVKRIKNMLDTHSGKVVIGGEVNADEKYISPTIITDVARNNLIMNEEIFGPILPIHIVADFDEALQVIKSQPDPLVIYAFTEKKVQIESIKNETNSGTILINDTILHSTINTIPFGGKNNSGLGRFYGKYSFDTFSQERPVMIRNYQRLGEVALSCRYPPYNADKLQMMRDSLDATYGVIPPKILQILFTTILQYIQSLFKKSDY